MCLLSDYRGDGGALEAHPSYVAEPASHRASSEVGPNWKENLFREKILSYVKQNFLNSQRYVCAVTLAIETGRCYGPEDL